MPTHPQTKKACMVSKPDQALEKIDIGPGFIEAITFTGIKLVDMCCLVGAQRSLPPSMEGESGNPTRQTELFVFAHLCTFWQRNRIMSTSSGDWLKSINSSATSAL
jgi:hypothetical protein